MIFEDRVSTYPNRYAMTEQGGNTQYVTLERADNPYTEGTPPNADLFNKSMAGYSQYEGCYFRLVDGESEWVNPPMRDTIEYRTTERVQGKPVYRKLLTNIPLPALGATTTVETWLDSGCRLVGVRGWIESEEQEYWSQLPVMDSWMVSLGMCILSPQRIQLRAHDDSSGDTYPIHWTIEDFAPYRAYIELKYTK